MPKGGHSIGFYVQCAIVAIAATCAIGFRATVEYASDTPEGMAIGVAALLLIGATMLLGLLHKRPGVLGRLARSQHCFIGAMVLVIAAAHWQFRGRQVLGLVAAASMLIIVLGYATKANRRRGWLRFCHRWLGYLLPFIVAAHAAVAVFLSEN